MCCFKRDAGTMVETCLAMEAFRTRVSMSATGSVIMVADSSLFPSSCLLPTRLRHAGNLPAQGELAEADAAERELADVGARAAAAAAPIMKLHLELRSTLPLLDLALLCHL